MDEITVLMNDLLPVEAPSEQNNDRILQEQFNTQRKEEWQQSHHQHRPQLDSLAPHLSNGVFQLSGPNDYLHLEDVTFGHASLNQSLQHFLLVQPVMRWKQDCEQKQPGSLDGGG